MNSAGRIGIFPYNYVEARSIHTEGDEFKIVKAVIGYEAQEPDELTFQVGDLITILKSIDEEWSLGRIFSRIGAQSKDRLKKRVVGKFQLNYVEETGKRDSIAAEEEEALVAQEEKEKERFSIALQKERFDIELDNERKYQLEQVKLNQQQESLQKLLLEERKQKEFEAETLKRKQVEMENEKKRLQDEMEMMKKQMEKYELEAEEARKKALKAEEELIAARAERERLKLIAVKRESLDEAAKQELEKRNQEIAVKVSETIVNNTSSDGFVSPPPMPEQKKFPVLKKFAKLGAPEETCKKCGKGVVFGPTGLKAMGASWHRDCFTCGTCSKVLRNGWLEHSGWPYCQQCHKAGFGIKGFGFGGAMANNYEAPVEP